MTDSASPPEIDLKKIPPSVPTVFDVDILPASVPANIPVTPMSEIAKAGVDLAKWVLVIVSVFVVVAVAVLAWSEFRSLSLIDANYSQLLKSGGNTETVTAMKELIVQLETQRKAFREFWLQFTQLVLLNLLLPVLTAILGYVFGSREGNNRGSDK
ncbi:hypothetical protein [Nitrosomonas sp. Nm166]|uniref:hypothetical protein n=1 Tax=Nitrosomonas sp. Nm166 TaxID=1881054 RepID=UPI0008EE5F7A|nr:hypothetical protein [Nitrosomonas sp. Nm166]SFD94413.1 hypothetical protein SAMN05428977_100327 [Nitrosomonas sp. Nm166]